jgi:hypothetical protein
LPPAGRTSGWRFIIDAEETRAKYRDLRRTARARKIQHEVRKRQNINVPRWFVKLTV